MTESMGLQWVGANATQSKGKARHSTHEVLQ